MLKLNSSQSFDYRQFRADLEPILEKALSEVYDEGETVASLSRSRVKFVMADVAYQALTLVGSNTVNAERDYFGQPRLLPQTQPDRGIISEGIKERVVSVKDPDNPGKVKSFHIIAKTTVASYTRLGEGYDQMEYIAEVEWWDESPPELHLSMASKYLTSRVREVINSGKFDYLQDHLKSSEPEG